MANNQGYPTVKLDILDSSKASTSVLTSQLESGLSTPIQFILAERGVPGRIYFGGGKEMTKAFGAESFLETSPYYTPATRMLGIHSNGGGVCAMRLAAADAKTSTFGLFLEVSLVNVIQYQKTASGALILDGSGNPTPKKLADNVTNETAPGVKIKWVYRKLADNESYRTLEPVVTGTGAAQKTTYPILAGEALSPGKYGNRLGFKLFSATSSNAAIADAVGSAIYRFAPMELPTSTSTTASAVVDRYGTSYNDFSFKNVAIYNPTATNYAFRSVIARKYADADTGDALLDFKILSYGQHIETIGNLIIGKSSDLTGVDPYRLDLIKGVDGNNEYIDVLQIDGASSGVVNSAVLNYFEGGDDGDVSFLGLQTLIRDWIAGTDHGEFKYLTKWPITHFFDPGFTQPTKLALFQLLTMRDNLNLRIATQDVLRDPNTKAEDLAIASVLAAQAANYPDSILNGVGCHRVAIYGQCGNLVNGTDYTGIVPLLVDRAKKLRDLNGGQRVAGSTAGQPNSNVNDFVLSSINWSSDDDDDRKTAWAIGLNTCMHASMNVIFYPDLRTVYEDDTSLLSNEEMSDYVSYAYMLSRVVWARQAGVRRPAEEMFSSIGEDMTNEINDRLKNGGVSVKVTVFQTAGDQNKGYVISANIAISSAMPFRQGNFTVELQRYEA